MTKHPCGGMRDQGRQLLVQWILLAETKKPRDRGEAAPSSLAFVSCVIPSSAPHFTGPAYIPQTGEHLELNPTASPSTSPGSPCSVINPHSH